MSKVLVTGSCGFLGHHLVKRLKQNGHYVIGIDDLSAGDEKWSDLVDNFIEWDICELLELPKVDYIFHTAAIPRIQISIEEPMRTNMVNIEGTLKLLNFAKNLDIKKFIYSASSSAYGNNKIPFKEDMKPEPLNPYALQKLTGEYYCKIYNNLFNLPTVSLRYFNVYGEDQDYDHPYAPVITKFLHNKENGKPLTIYGDGNQRRDFTYIGDVVEANILAMHTGNGVINIGNGENVSVNEVADMIGGERVYEKARIGEIRETLADNSKARRMLGWKPKTQLKRWIDDVCKVQLSHKEL